MNHFIFKSKASLIDFLIFISYRVLFALITLILAISLTYYLIYGWMGDIPLHHQQGLDITQTLDPSSAMVFDYSSRQNQTNQYILMGNLQYSFDHLFSLIGGNFGPSYYFDSPVYTLIFEKLGLSFCLMTLSVSLLYTLAIGLAIIKTFHLSPWRNQIVNLVLTPLSILPSSLIALILLNVLATQHGFAIFPFKHLESLHSHTSGWLDPIHAWPHYVLPLTAIVLPRLLPLTQLIERSLLHQVTMPYCLMAKAKGHTSASLRRAHLLPNALPAIISTFPGVFIKLLFSSTLISELVFSLDGIGYLTFTAALNYDYPLLLSILYVTLIINLLLYLLVDSFYALWDPRLSLRTQE